MVSKTTSRKNAENARRLWENKKQITLSHPFGFDFVLRRRKKIVDGVGKPKGIIAEYTVGEFSHLAYYPKPEHFDIFARAAENSKHGSFARVFPGSVGTAATMIRKLDDKEHLILEDIQGSFIQGKPKELTRSLATKYNGWRIRVLNEVFEDAEARHIPVALMQSGKYEAAMRSAEIRKRIFIEFAEKKGYHIREHKGFTIAEK